MRGVSIIVIRWNGKNFINSKPCKHCSSLIKSIGIKSVLYSDQDGNIVHEKAKFMQSDHLSIARKSKMG